MQALRSRGNIRVWAVVLSLAAASAFSGGETALAQDTTKETTTTGNRVFFRGGYGALLCDRAGELITDGHGAAGKNDGSGGYYLGGGADHMPTKGL